MPHPTPIAPPAETKPTTLERVREIQREHFKQTGRSLDTDSALRCLDRRKEATRAYLLDFPVRPWQVAIVVRLVELEYEFAAIDEILGDLARHGTARAAAYLDPEHTAEISAMMPPKADEKAPSSPVLTSVRAAAYVARHYDSLDAWLVLDHLADALENGTAGELARLVALGVNPSPLCDDSPDCSCAGCKAIRAAYASAESLSDPSTSRGQDTP